MTLIVDVFLNLQTRKDVIREMSKMSRLRGSLDKELGKWAKTLL